MSGGNRPPITAIIIFRNEQEKLERCLQAIRWCDELIAIDMASTDASRAVAARYADRLFEVDQHPIAEPTRVVAGRLARHDWILMIDPDEIMPAPLADQIQRTLACDPDLGALMLPWRFYFKGKRLDGTVWGTPAHKRMVFNRTRCKLLPLCNRITELLPGAREVKLPHDENHLRHEWCDSYRELMHKHFVRYSHMEAKAMVASGEKFSLRRGVVEPLRQLRISLKDFDGWRLGPRGFALSAIYFGYCLASQWLTLWYRGTVQTEAPDTHAALPELRELPLHPQPKRAAA